MLEGRGIVHRYGPEIVLSGVDVLVPQHSSLAVTGSSGSGKSTLLHILAGLIQPTEGQVLFEDRRIDHLSERERAELRLTRLGFVFQFGELVPELTVLENVELPLRLAGSPLRDARRRAQALLEELGVAEHADKRLAEISGGQTQRVAVARALVNDPAAVIADEPTGALDDANSAVVLRLLLDAVRGHGASLLLATHDSAVARYCDQVLTLAAGTLALA
jgi:putative ABC transport system ATP-binding protein